jgi:segregation and condensation protein B
MTEDRHMHPDPGEGEGQYHGADTAEDSLPPREPDTKQADPAAPPGPAEEQTVDTAQERPDPTAGPDDGSRGWDDPGASRRTPSDDLDEEEVDSGGDVDSDQATHAEIDAVVEAVLFATSSPISPAKIAQVAELPNRRVVKRSVRRLNDRYEQMGCSFRVEGIAGGYQMFTLEQYDDVVSRLFKVKSDSKLSQAAMETLSIIAYRQPIIRADIEAIRGVSSGEMVRKLMEKGLVKIVGRAEVLGRPMLYGTTRAFLEVFGLEDIDDLPRVEELRKPEEPAAPAATEQANTEETAGEQPEEQTEETPAEEPPSDQSAEGSKQTAAVEPSTGKEVPAEETDHPDEEESSEEE